MPFFSVEYYNQLTMCVKNMLQPFSIHHFGLKLVLTAVVYGVNGMSCKKSSGMLLTLWYKI